MTMSDVVPIVMQFCNDNDDNTKSLQHVLTNISVRNAVNKNVSKLKQLDGWASMPDEAFELLRCIKAKVFVSIMLKAAKEHYHTNGMCMMHLWKRLVASGQENILTYVVWKRIESVCQNDKYLSTFRLLDAAALGKDIISRIDDGTTSESIKMKLCAALMIGDLSISDKDLKASWRDWAIEHHPDHGGDPDVFISVKTIYELWSETNDK